MKTMKTATVIIACVCSLGSLTAEAGWEGYLLATNTGIFDWNQMERDFNSPIKQSWSGSVERYETAADAAWIALDQLYLSVGWSNQIVTNGGFVYTNRLEYYEYRNFTNAMDPVDYTYTNPGDGVLTTNTAYPPMSLFSAGAWQAFWAGPAVIVKDHFRWAARSESAGGTFDDYFALGTTSHPAAVPAESFANLQSGHNIGMWKNLVSNEWGFVTDGDHMTTVMPERDFDWILGEIHCTDTNTWVHYDFEVDENPPFLDGHYIGAAYPVAHYMPVSSGVYSSVSLAITGWTLDTNWPADAAPAFTNAIQSVSGEYTQMGLRWQAIKSVTSSSPANVQDAIAFIWTNPIALWSDRFYTPYASAPARMFPEVYDDIYLFLNELLWTMYPHPDIDWVGFANNQYSWSGSSTNSLAEAIAEAETNATISSSGGAPLRYSTGSFDGTWYDANAISRASRLVVRDIGTNTSRTIDFYVYAEAPAGGAWDAQGTVLREDIYTMAVQAADEPYTSVTSGVFGLLTVPSWGGTPSTNGWVAGGEDKQWAVGIWDFIYQ